MGLKKKFSVSIIGHRGFKKKYPENTLLSFEKAIEFEADYVELDVHLTLDNELVVSHDGNTARCGNIAYNIRQTPLETLKTVDMGQGQQIPTLQEVIDLCKGKIGIQIEIKHEGLAEKVARSVEENDMIDDVGISSFIHSELQEVKKINPNIWCASLEPAGPKNIFTGFLAKKIFIAEAERLQADAIHPLYFYVNSNFVQAAHTHNKMVVPWTPDNPKEW
jgi:glycerophosphoryl diester phosphodiesterase